jgi:hypothetical protein
MLGTCTRELRACTGTCLWLASAQGRGQAMLRCCAGAGAVVHCCCCLGDTLAGGGCKCSLLHACGCLGDTPHA